MIKIRAATQDDHPLIFATWLRSYRHGAQFPRHIPERIFFAAHHNIIEALLERSSVFVAHPVDDPQVILGWAVIEQLPSEGATPSGLCVHYTYVKPAFRRSGIARQLLDHVAGWQADGHPVTYSHETFTLKLPQLSAVVAGWEFNPYAALQHAAGQEATR